MSESKVGGRRWRRWVLAALCLGLLGSLVAYRRGYFNHHYQFRVETEQVMRRLGAGEQGATTAYEQASLPLRKSRLLASFVDRADRMTKTLGSFQAIVGVNEVETLSTLRGRTARIEYDFRFAQGAVTPGEVSFLLDSEGIWRLLGYTVWVPISLAAKVESVDSEINRIRAPEEVRKLLVSILEATARGEGMRVREDAALPFRRSSSAVQFEKMLASVGRELGAFEHVLEFSKSDHSENKKLAKLTAILQYEKARTTGTFEFIKVENKGEWRLLRFKVLIPEPLLPRRFR